MGKFAEVVLGGAAMVAWVCGIAIAKGFWMTLGCVFLPPMAWVVLAQWCLLGTAP